MADTPVLGTGAARHGGSSPLSRIANKIRLLAGFCLLYASEEDEKARAGRRGGVAEISSTKLSVTESSLAHLIFTRKCDRISLIKNTCRGALNRSKCCSF